MSASHNLGPEKGLAAVTRYLDTSGVCDMLHEHILIRLRGYIERHLLGFQASKAIISKNWFPCLATVGREGLMHSSYKLNDVVSITVGHNTHSLWTITSCRLAEIARATIVTSDMLFYRGQSHVLGRQTFELPPQLRMEQLLDGHDVQMPRSYPNYYPSAPNNYLCSNVIEQLVGRTRRYRSHVDDEELHAQVKTAPVPTASAPAPAPAAAPTRHNPYRFMSYTSFAQRIGDERQQNRLIVDEAHNIIEPARISVAENHEAHRLHEVRRLLRNLDLYGVDQGTIHEMTTSQTHRRLNDRIGLRVAAIASNRDRVTNAQLREREQVITSIVRKTCRDNVREIVDTYHVQRALNDAIADLFGENDRQRERTEIQKILDHWNTQKSVKFTIEQMRIEQEQIRSETVWGGLDKISMGLTVEKKTPRWHPQNITDAQQCGLSAAQVLSLLPNDSALTAFLNSEALGDLLYTGDAWWMQNIAATIRCFAHRLANGSLTCATRLFSKLVKLLPPMPTPAMLNVLPELADEYKSNLDACNLYINLASNAPYTMLHYFQLKHVFAEAISQPGWFFTHDQFLLSQRTHYLRQYDPLLYDEIALAMVHSLNIEYLVHTLLPKWDAGKVLLQLFSRPIPRGVNWITIVTAVKQVHIEDRKNAAIAAVIWLDPAHRVMAASNFWADETCRTGDLLDVIAEQGPIDKKFGNTEYETIAYNLAQAPVSPSFAVWLIKSCTRISPKVVLICLPSFRDLLVENANKLDMYGLQMMQQSEVDYNSYSRNDAILDWMLLAKNGFMIENLPKWRVRMMLQLWDHRCEGIMNAFVNRGASLVGYVTYREIEQVLIQLTFQQRELLLSNVLSIHRVSSHALLLGSVDFRKFTIEYLSGEIDVGVKFNLNELFYLTWINKELKEAAALAWRVEWGAALLPTAQFQELPFWLQLHLMQHSKVQPERLPAITSRTHLWEGNNICEVAELALIADGRNVNTWHFKNGNGSDAGGICREFYASGGDEIRENIMELRDGYLVPRVNIPLKQLRVIGALMARSIFVDRHCMGLDLHPVLLMYLVCKGDADRWMSLEMAPWSPIRKLLGDDWCKLLAPLASQRAAQNTPPNSCEFWTEMRVHFRGIHSQITAIVDGWRIYEKGTQVLCPKMLDAVLRGDRSCNVERLFSLLTVVDGVDGEGELDDPDDVDVDNLDSQVEAKNLRTDIYRTSIEAILRRWSLDKRRELYRFWFGTEQPDLVNSGPPYIYIHRNQGREYAISHTCNNSMELTWINSFDPEEIQHRVERMLDLSIGNQRVAREAGHLFQIS